MSILLHVTVINIRLDMPFLHVHLQQFLFEEMAKRHERVTLDNTTQVSNYPVVRNHAKSGRRPDHIEFVMFRGPHRR